MEGMEGRALASGIGLGGPLGLVRPRVVCRRLRTVAERAGFLRRPPSVLSLNSYRVIARRNQNCRPTMYRGKAANPALRPGYVTIIRP
jgi:hypothetical protein